MNVTRSMSQADSPSVTGNAQQSILIVEDEQAICKLLTTTLQESGFAVKVARSSVEAIRLLEAEEFALVLLDWYLAKADEASQDHVTGRAVFEKCRQRYPATPIIAISGVTEVAVREDVLLMGADSFLAKPFPGAMLVWHIRKLLSRAGARIGEFRFNQESDILPMDELRKKYLRAVVDFLDGNISRAAEKLGMHRHTVTTVLQE